MPKKKVPASVADAVADAVAVAQAAQATQDAVNVAKAAQATQQAVSYAHAAQTTQKAVTTAKKAQATPPKRPQPKRRYTHPEAKKVAKHVVQRGLEDGLTRRQMVKATERVAQRLGWDDPRKPSKTPEGRKIQSPPRNLHKQAVRAVDRYLSAGPENTERPEPRKPVRRDPRDPTDGPVDTERPAPPSPRLPRKLRTVTKGIDRKLGVITGETPSPQEKRRVTHRLKKAVRKAGPDVSEYADLGPAAKELAEGAVKYGKKFGVRPSFLMGIAENETGFGAAAGSGTPGSGAVSSAGAQGYMQFMPASRDAVLKATGYDAFSKDPKEAMAAAAGYFSVFAPDAKSDWDRAFSYNQADWYADDVTSDARKYRDLDHATGENVKPALKRKARRTIGPLNTKAILKDVDLSPAAKVKDPAQRRAVKQILVGKMPKDADKLIGKAAVKALREGGRIVKIAGSKGPVDSAADELANGMIEKATKSQLKHFSFGAGDRAWFDPILMKQLVKLSKATGEPITLNSGFRTLDEQKAAYADFQAGGALAATPGSSNHEYGLAADVSLTSDQRARLAEFGLGLPVGGEDWHVEVVDPALKAQQTARNLGTTSGETAPVGPKIKGTDLVVAPRTETGTASTGGTSAFAGTSAGTSTGGPTGKGKKGRRRRRRRPIESMQLDGDDGLGTYLAVGADTPTDPFIERLIELQQS